MTQEGVVGESYMMFKVFSHTKPQRHEEFFTVKPDLSGGSVPPRRQDAGAPDESMGARCLGYPTGGSGKFSNGIS